MIDWITQNLTIAPLWVQALVVFSVVLPLCAVLGLLLMRGLDLVVEQVKRLFPGSGEGGIGEAGPAS